MTEMQKLEYKISMREYNKPYNELQEMEQYFIDTAVCDIMAAKYNN